MTAHHRISPRAVMEPPPSISPIIGNSETTTALRSKNGCFTCRRRKVKCDEERPRCCRCTRLDLFCDYNPRMRHRYTKFVESKGSSKRRKRRSCISSIPAQLSDLTISASSLELTPADHESIRYFHTTLATLYHRKNSNYSLRAIIFCIAKREPMVMRMVLAFAGQEIEHRKRCIPNYTVGSSLSRRRNSSPLAHYSSALRMMAETIQKLRAFDDEECNLDTILATLHLMVMFEKHHGDDSCLGLSNHLAGTAQVVQHQFRNHCAHVLDEKNNQEHVVGLTPAKQHGDRAPILSLFSARILIHIAGYDICAASFGIGGRLAEALSEMLHLYDTNFSYLDILQRFSNPLYDAVWGESYPQAEQVDDLENRAVFSLATAAGHVRFMVSRLRAVKDKVDKAVLQRVGEVQQLIKLIAFRFDYLLTMADELPMSTDNSHRFVANIRDTVPNFYAAQIDFCRVKRELGVQDDFSTDKLVLKIIKLALQAHEHQGDEGLLRVAWPLYIAALETNNYTHLEWIVCRFRALSAFCKNFERACHFLEGIIAKQRKVNIGSGEQLDNPTRNCDAAFVL